MNEQLIKDISYIFVGFGVGFILLGILSFMDGSLLALGNYFFLMGCVMNFGLKNLLPFFFATRNKIIGSLLFFVGISLILMRWALFGIIIELIGFYYLFGGFIPAVIAFLKSLPVVGHLFMILSFILPKFDEEPHAKIN